MTDRREAARKAWETRRQKDKTARRRQAALKAWVTIRRRQAESNGSRHGSLVLDELYDRTIVDVTEILARLKAKRRLYLKTKGFMEP